MMMIVMQVAAAQLGVLSLGEWLAIIAAGTGIGSLVWRTAVVSTKTGQIEGLMTRELIIINEKLDSINEHVEEADKRQVADVRWATETSTRLGAVERRVDVIDKEQRTGPSDRRQS